MRWRRERRKSVFFFGCALGYSRQVQGEDKILSELNMEKIIWYFIDIFHGPLLMVHYIRFSAAAEQSRWINERINGRMCVWGTLWKGEKNQTIEKMKKKRSLAVLFFLAWIPRSHDDERREKHCTVLCYINNNIQLRWEICGMSWGLKSSYTAKEFFNRTSLLMITDGKS